jgi:hypothetical protein
MPLPYTSNGEIVILQDDFLGAALNPAIGGTTENSGTAAIVVAQEGGAGGLVTGATSGNRSQFTTGLNHRASSGSIIVQWRVKNVSAITTRALFVGLTDTVSIENPIELAGTTFTANATDAVGFVYDTAATTDVWYYVGANNGAVVGGSAVQFNGANAAPSADVYENFRIEVTPDGDAVFSYGKDNGTSTNQGMREIGRIEGAIGTGVNLTPITLIETRTAGASTAYVDSLYVASGREQN